MKGHTPVDYLVVGHISRDITPHGPAAGGTVTYAGRTAHALGCRTAVVTSAGPDFDVEAALPGIIVEMVPAAKSTSFENIYTPSGRQQRLHGRAAAITAMDIPVEWQRAPIVHLGPIANEIDKDVIGLFSNSVVGLTPQGWLRRWDAEGRVFAQKWADAHLVLPLAAAVVLSVEDLPDVQMLEEFRQWARLVVLTEAAAGCTVFFGDEVRQIPAPTVQEVNPTGAGDVFIAAFLIHLYQTKGDPWAAAVYANYVAAHSVTQDTMDDKIEALRRLEGGWA